MIFDNYSRSELIELAKRMEELLNRCENDLWMLSLNNGPSGEQIDRQKYAESALKNLRQKWDNSYAGLNDMKFHCSNCNKLQAVLFGHEALCSECCELDS